MRRHIIHDRLLFKRLYVSRQDLSWSARYAATILKKGWHHPPWFGRGVAYLHQSAFTSALVLSYCRAFMKSYSLPMLPRHFWQYEPIEHELHKEIVDLRNQVYAHADGRKYDAEPWGGNKEITIETFPTLSLSAMDVKRLQRMISSVIGNISSELELVRARL